LPQPRITTTEDRRILLLNVRKVGAPRRPQE
jgi:hypothetical protein